MDKRYNHEQFEKEARQKWESQKTYSLENNPGKLYSIDTPPPTVSGSLHIGHIFSYTQTDIIARYKRMCGLSVFYPFGFDDNGLPTERYVEKKRKISAYQMTRSEFIKICLEETHEAEQKFKELWQKIGLSADWSKCYSTISPDVRKISQESFIRLFKKGFVYRKNEPALYCTTCYTSVAQAELDDQELPSHFNDIVFYSDKGERLIIGTTRPELLPSCVALLFNPKDSRYEHLKNSKAIVPIFNYEVPILEDEHVNPEKGTGLVMCCTFGDKTDIEWYKKFNLPYRQSVGLDGRWTKLTWPLEGLKVHEARKKILELLQEKLLLLNQRPVLHAVNVHERCKKEIEYIEIPQWYIKILEHKNVFLKLADNINWYPAFMKSRYNNWVENLSWDWGISRQRFYGIPFPVWHCVDCKAILLPEIKDLPVDPRENKFNNGKCTECSGHNIVPDTDVMDTWNTSSLTPQICYNLWINSTKPELIGGSPFCDKEVENFIPMSLRPQAHDIIRTWAFDTIVKSWMHFDKIPWTNIVISGHVLSSGKDKISKSKENESITPENLLSRYNADVIRYWTASGTLGQDMAFSETQLIIGQKLVTKLWNAFKFCKEHLENFTPDNKSIELGVHNEWILDQATDCFDKYQKYFEQNEFGLALDVVERFFWKSFCDIYLEVIKDQLFNPDKYSEDEIKSTKQTLYNIGLRILQLYAPYLPYITECLYENIYQKNLGANSIHLTKFQNIQEPYNNKQSDIIMSDIIKIISEVQKLKTEQKLSLKTEIHELEIYGENLQELKSQEKLIKGITQAKNIIFIKNKIEISEIKQENNFWYLKVRI